MKNKIINIITKRIAKFGYSLQKLDATADNNFYKKYYCEDSIANKKFYNISAGGHLYFGGGFHNPMWRNIDIMKSQNGWKFGYNKDKDIIFDILDNKPLPIESNSAEVVQCQYTIEHLPNETVAFLFSEIYRILKPGGTFKIVTPNSYLDYAAYTNNDISYYLWRKHQSVPAIYEILGYKMPLNQASFEQVLIAHIASNASTIHVADNPQKISDEEFKDAIKSLKMEDLLEYCTSKCSIEIQKKFRCNHFSWWTHDKLKTYVNNSGFKDYNILSAGQSSIPILRNNRYFDNLWNFASLFVETKK